MADELKKHRVIGIRHTLKKMKEADLISEQWLCAGSVCTYGAQRSNHSLNRSTGGRVPA